MDIVAQTYMQQMQHAQGRYRVLDRSATTQSIAAGVIVQ